MDLLARLAEPEHVAAPYLLLTWTPPAPIPQLLASGMGLVNPPEHARQRGLIARDCTPRRVADLPPRIDKITGELLDDIEPRLRADESRSAARSRGRT